MEKNLKTELENLVDESCLNEVLQTLSIISKESFKHSKNEGFKVIADDLDNLLEKLKAYKS